MRAFVCKTAKILCLAKFFASVAFCLLLVTSPALAAPNYANEITGDFQTDGFNAKIHLIESESRLMLTGLNWADGRQAAPKTYPIEFKLSGKGWSAQLADPIRMEIHNIPSLGGHVSVIRANVIFTSYEDFDQTETRSAVATLRLDDEGILFFNSQNASLQITDGADPGRVLYSSGDLHDGLDIYDGEFDAETHGMKNVNLLSEEDLARMMAVNETTPENHDAIETESITGNAPITHISANFPINPPVFPPQVDDRKAYDYSLIGPGTQPITQISIDPSVVQTPEPIMAPSEPQPAPDFEGHMPKVI